MKDQADNLTPDMLTKRGPGRPVTGKAKTQAQLQREYRQRVKKRKAELLQPLCHSLTGDPLDLPDFIYSFTVPEINRAQRALELAFLVPGTGWTDPAAYQLYCKLNERDKFPGEK